MNTVIIGSGNVAYHLAKAFALNGMAVSVAGRNQEALQAISSEFSIPYFTQIPEEADVYLLAVKDSAVAEVAAQIPNKNALVAHTSGAVALAALQASFRRGVFYPLQTFSKSKELNYSEIPFFVEAENTEDLHILTSLARKISSKVMEADSEKRKYIHLTAVFASNFVNHLFARAKEIAGSQDIPFEYFLPLIQETVDKIHQMDPYTAQTGPARRKDEHVLHLHKELLSGESLEIYNTMNRSIKKMYEL